MPEVILNPVGIHAWSEPGIINQKFLCLILTGFLYLFSLDAPREKPKNGIQDMIKEAMKFSV